MNEFELIQKYFTRFAGQRKDVIAGIGDDAALLQVPAQHELVVTADTLNMGIHFDQDATPFEIGYKALAVNLSDMAAMGATPAWVTLAISLPAIDENWCEQFCLGFYSLIEQYQLQLIGGDTTRGPLSITMNLLGWVPSGQALRRNAAQVGDRIYVTGTIGDAGVGLAITQQKITLPQAASFHVLNRLHCPTPRVNVGLALRGIAHAAIDISDGLMADLKHILDSSHVGATINVDQLPLSDSLLTLNKQQASQYALAAGDDYELCFTVSPENEAKLKQKLDHGEVAYQCIGVIEAEIGLRVRCKNGENFTVQGKGYQHFS